MSAIDLFKRSEAALEYRPVRVAADKTKWYWTLLPLPLEDTAVAVGVADSKGDASLAARKAARKAGRRVTRVTVYHPSLTQPQEQAGPEPPEPEL